MAVSDEALEACIAGWDDGAARARAAAQLGLAIDDELARGLKWRLDDANADRRKYKLALADLVRAICEAADAGIAVRHGGKGGKFAETPTTVALAVKCDREVVLAIGTCPARSASPGSAWKQLAPWQQNMAKNLQRAQAWAANRLGKFVVPLVERAAPDVKQSRVTRDALLAEVLARPDDDEPRLVYADALAKRGDPRGELIVVQCALAKAEDPKLRKRELALLRKHGATWMSDVKQAARACTMRRGFVTSVTMTAAQFATHAARMFEREPIEELVILEPSARGLSTLGRDPHLARLTSIIFDERVWLGNAGQIDECGQFLASPHLANARRMKLLIAYWRDFVGDVPKLFDGITWTALESLELRLVGDNLTPWDRFARAQLPKLRELAITPFDRELAAAFPAAQVR